MKELWTRAKLSQLYEAPQQNRRQSRTHAHSRSEVRKQQHCTSRHRQRWKYYSALYAHVPYSNVTDELPTLDRTRRCTPFLASSQQTHICHQQLWDRL